MNDMILIVLTLFGIGIFTGTYGVGSALFTIPCLITLFSYFDIIPEPERYKFAQGGAFIIMIITSFWIVKKYFNFIDWKIFKIFCIPTILGICIGFEIMSKLKIKDLERLFSIYLFFVAAFILIQWFLGKKIKTKRKKFSIIFVTCTGVMVGIKVGIFGPGGETLVIPIMRSFNQNLKKSIATMSLLSLIVGIFGIVLFYILGVVKIGFYSITLYAFKDIICVSFIVVLSYFTIRFGVVLNKKLSEHTLLILYAIILCIIAIYMM